MEPSSVVPNPIPGREMPALSVIPGELNTMNDGRMVVASNSLIEEICREGERTYPEECCGVLLGSVTGNHVRIHKAIPLANLQVSDRERRFLITADQYRIAEKSAEADHLEVLGVYHSHPNHPARPSEFDREHALPLFVYLIVSVVSKRSVVLTFWELTEDRTRFDQLTIHPRRDTVSQPS